MLRERSDTPVTLFVDLGNNASSTHFGDVNDALTRLALDDAHQRCKYLDVTLPSTDDNTLPVPGVDNDPVALTLPQVQTLVWRSDQRDIPMMYPATLTHLTNLTLRTRITFRDCLYILGCIRDTVQYCDVRDLYEGYGNNLLPYPNGNTSKDRYGDEHTVMSELRSFSVRVASSPVFFMNHLKFHGVLLQTLAIEVLGNGSVDPKAMKTIPWATITNITLTGNFVDDGANWVQAATEGSLQLDLRSGRHVQG
ncbi:hypothetical protein H0H93_012816 [Arthromyces matolae]|nr:hypothetical protein H0H93_012816 [Arthromyces matolae]